MFGANLSATRKRATRTKHTVTGKHLIKKLQNTSTPKITDFLFHIHTEVLPFLPCILVPKNAIFSETQKNIALWTW